MHDAHIVDVVFRTGGRRVLQALGESDDGSGMLRDAIATLAQNGGASVVNDAIVSLGFGASNAPLTDDQLGELGDSLVQQFVS
jgi:hypothetical protein